MQTELKQLHSDCLQPGQYQPRQDFNPDALQELALSIASQGLVEPIVVRPIAKQRYEIIAGERRWRAAQLAGLEMLPCMVGNYSDKQACALTLVENIQRYDLNLMEEATAYRRLIDEFHYQQDELAVLVGKSRSHVANIVRLVHLIKPVQDLIRKRVLTLGHARLLVGLPAKQQEEFAEQVMLKTWSVRQLEQEIKKNNLLEKEVFKNPSKDKDVARLQMILSEQIGAPVQIIGDAQDGGWLQVQFFNNDTLAGVLERLGLSYD